MELEDPYRGTVIVIKDEVAPRRSTRELIIAFIIVFEMFIIGSFIGTGLQ